MEGSFEHGVQGEDGTRRWRALDDSPPDTGGGQPEPESDIARSVNSSQAEQPWHLPDGTGLPELPDELIDQRQDFSPILAVGYMIDI